MKSIKDYVAKHAVNEAGWSSSPKGKDGDVKVTDVDDVNIKDIAGVTQGGKEMSVNSATRVKKGVSADDNGTKGIWAVDPPAGDDADGQQWTLIDPSSLSKNQRRVASMLDSERDFVTFGEAGWGKTSEIMTMAHKFGYTVITVYLDKAEATDLGGIPIPVKNDKGRSYVDYLMPAWAAYMIEHPDTKFLLFFDEMNQADPGVQNALMPIVLNKTICGVKFDNYMVAAAGNFSYENSSVNELSGPLKARFKVFTWQTRTSDTWASHFAWAHKNYDDKIGPEIIDKVESLEEYWGSPRDVTLNIYDWAVNAKRKGRILDTPEDIAEDLMENTVYKDADKDSRTLKNAINEFAEWLVKWANNAGKAKAEERRRASKTMENITPEVKNTFIRTLQDGYFEFKKSDGGDGKKYLATPENIIGDENGGIFDINEYKVTPEILKKIIQQMEDSGKGPRFANNKEGEATAKKNGWIII